MQVQTPAKLVQGSHFLPFHLLQAHEASKDDAKLLPQVKGDIMPLVTPKATLEMMKITEDMKVRTCHCTVLF